jgi:hypothetical protein
MPGEHLLDGPRNPGGVGIPHPEADLRAAAGMAVGIVVVATVFSVIVHNDSKETRV